MRFASALLAVLVIGALAPASAQRARTPSASLLDRFGAGAEEVLDKYGDDPAALARIEAEVAAARRIRPFHFGHTTSFARIGAPSVVRSEREPNDFFPTADNLDDVLATPGFASDRTFSGGLVMGTFTAGDFDVFVFTADTTRMYYFGATHTYPGTENVDEDGFAVSARLFHESDLDTTFVQGFNGIAGNDQIRGDILGRTTDGRANSGDFRLTGWVPPVDPATNRKVMGRYYLFLYNGTTSGAPRPIQSLGATGTYHFSAYAVPLAPLVGKAEPNQTFTQALQNPNAVLPADGVLRSYLGYNPDTLKVVTTDGDANGFDILPTQGNAAFPQLLARGDEDVDHYRIDDLKANHSVVVETVPFFGYYRETDGSISTGNTRWTDTRIRLYDANYTTVLAEDDDGARETQTATGQPNNIHGRIVYEVAPADVGGPLWLWVSAWASNTRELTDPGGPSFRGVDNRDPGRFAYRLYAHQYANSFAEADFEATNNTADGAMGIIARNGEAIAASFTGAGDADWYRIYLNETRMYSLLSASSGLGGAIGVELYHEAETVDGTVTRSADLFAGQGVAGALGDDFRAGGFVPEASGAYLLKVTGPAAGDYQLVVAEDQTFGRLIAHEPDDTAPQALALDPIEVGVGAPRREGMIFPVGDVDHYTFDGVAGQQVGVKLQSVAWRVGNRDLDLEVRLLDATLAELAAGTATAEAFSQLTFALPADGTYVIQVRAAAGNAGTLGDNTVGLYSLNVGDAVREQEPNDSPATATVLLDGFVAADMAAGDTDWYRIPVQAGRIYHVRRANATGGEFATVDLFDAADPATSVYDGSGWNGRYGDGDFKVQILPTQDGAFLLQLADAEAGSYEVHVKSTDVTALAAAFEPNDETAQAPTISPDGTRRVAMFYNPADPEFALDRDLYRVDVVEAGQTLVCESEPFTSEFWSRDTDLFSKIRNAAGEVVASDDDGGFDWHTRSTYAVTAPGTYYCEFGSQDFIDEDAPANDDRDPTTGEYAFRISYVGVEAEPNDDLATATRLGTQGRIEATLEAGDVDTYRLDLKAGSIYHVRTVRGEGMGEFGSAGAAAQLLDANGASVTDTETGSWRTRNDGGNVKLNLVPTADVTYYLQIPAPADLGDGTYQVLMKATPVEPLAGAGEPNNTFDAADARPSVADAGRLDAMLYDASVEGFHDDLDYYWVDAQPGDVITGETFPFDGELWPRDLDVYMYLYGPQGGTPRQELASDDDGGFDWHSRIEHTVTEAGRYYVLVVGQDAHVAPRNDTANRFRDPARGEYQFALTTSDGTDTAAEGDPDGLALFDSYPNPSSGEATIVFQTAEPGPATLVVFDAMGRRVATLVDGAVSAGRHEARFDGSALAPGVYFYQLRAANTAFTKRMTVVR